MPRGKVRRTPEEFRRFVRDNSTPDPDTGCRIWNKATDKDGYAVTCFNGKQCRGTRAVFEAVHGRKPVGVVRHSCHNPSCVEETHLSEGTQKENIQDSVRAGRRAVGERHPAYKHGRYMNG